MTGVMELQLDDGPRLSLGIGPGSDDVMGPHWEFARKFTEGIEKLTGNTLRDHWKKTERLIVRMREVIRLAGGLVFTQRRLALDTGVPQEGGLGSGRRPNGVEPL
ncbi:hypothetical protein GW17_00056563 [Ensete ventricosum]|nr:hypothetical protein GW17_00056563 [Ensete ventricosum]